MARKSKRAALVLSPQHRATLKELAGSRTAPAREVERAKVLLGYADGISITELQRQLGFGRPMIYRCVDKALAAGVQMGLKDKYHRPHEPEISDEAKAWVVSIACTKPKDHGLASELWSIAALARFVSERAEGAGFARLSGAGKSIIWRILDDNDIKPHKIRYQARDHARRSRRCDGAAALQSGRHRRYGHAASVQARGVTGRRGSIPSISTEPIV